MAQKQYYSSNSPPPSLTQTGQHSKIILLHEPEHAGEHKFLEQINNFTRFYYTVKKTQKCDKSCFVLVDKIMQQITNCMDRVSHLTLAMTCFMQWDLLTLNWLVNNIKYLGTLTPP